MTKPSFVLLDTSYPINIRNQKIICSLQDAYPGTAVSVITWNRDQRPSDVSDGNCCLYHRSAAYGNPLKKLTGLFGFRKYIKSELNRICPDIIIASHWDTLILAASLKNKNQFLIYENLDVPTSSLPFILHILRWLERRALRRTDLIIHASRFFKKLYSHIPVKQIILENKPTLLLTESVLEKREKFRVSFIGTIRYLDILKNLADAVRVLEGVELHFYGEGPDFNAMKAYTAHYPNVFLHGIYHYSDIQWFYLNSDLIWGAYSNKIYNVKYAISNKFHESMFFQRPCVFANHTELGNLVKEKEIGFTVDPYSVHDITDLISSLIQKPEKLETVKQNMKTFYSGETKWKEDFRELKDNLDELFCKNLEG